jgi:hypothetical protein
VTHRQIRRTAKNPKGLVGSRSAGPYGERVEEKGAQAGVALRLFPFFSMEKL